MAAKLRVCEVTGKEFRAGIAKSVHMSEAECRALISIARVWEVPETVAIRRLIAQVDRARKEFER